ncbi:MAG: acetyl-CoA carboxylase carboxyl transferase subunit alpha [Helicobacteraceae bacterium]|jgi:acetyl-CoA carboxylase carboxyl transferase subunit alpha|nr:acetyl-CoA carboxylase carboxyl transferase subunit alpha [Helicobacteraceae bacterium]
MAFYLDFEQPLKGIEEELELAKIRKDEKALEARSAEMERAINKVYGNLSDYQRLQLARHQDRPYSLDYIKLIMQNAYELHGDRHYKDDSAIVCFVGEIDGVACVVIGEEKGRGTKTKIARNFGMPHPEGYRKALRAARFAEKFNLPVLMLVDTPGAYPGVGAEERGQSEAIAKNLYEFSGIEAITISVVIGEGGSGGALAIAVADRLAMLSNSVFSVISPEGCAAILWNDPSKVETATKALKITPEILKSYGLIDDIIAEPVMGAHRDKKGAAEAIKEYFLQAVSDLSAQSNAERLANRYAKLMKLGKFSS